MHAINEYAISLINYYFRILEIEPSAYANLDLEVRKILIEHTLFIICLWKKTLSPRIHMGREHRNILKTNWKEY